MKWPHVQGAPRVLSVQRLIDVCFGELFCAKRKGEMVGGEPGQE